MQRYPSAWACYSEAHHNRTINDETLIGICEDFLAMPEEDRVQADRDICAARRREGNVAPDPNVAHCAAGTCHPECAEEPDTFEGRLGFYGETAFKDRPGLKAWFEEGAREAAKEMMERKMTEAGIVRLNPAKPEGVSSGIALQAQYEAEMDRIQKDIAAQYIKFAYEPQAEDSKPNLGKIQDKLTRQLFMTDPAVHAYVARHAETPERFPGLMEKAFTMGWTRNPKYPQECAWVEACHSRACQMMGHDPDLK